MMSIPPSRAVHDTAAVQSSQAPAAPEAGFQDLAAAMDLLSDFRVALDSIYSKQRDLNKRQQAQAQEGALNKAVEVFDDKQKSAADTMKVEQGKAIAGIASASLNIVGSAAAVLPIAPISSSFGAASQVTEAAKLLQAGGAPALRATGGLGEGVASLVTSHIERDAATERNAADLTQMTVGALGRTSDDSQAASREASAKLADNMKSINDILASFLSNPQFR